MIYKYGLINHFEKINAYLSIILLDGHQNIIPSQDEDMLVYEKDDKIYRIDIFNLKKYVKVKFQGLIYLPNYELIAILNGYLGKYNIMLSSKDESGFYIDKIDNHYLVKVKKDTLIADGTFVKEDRVATAKDLDINEKDEIINLDDEDIDDRDLGKDFFQMEEKQA
jgi:hypothetical protein